MGALKNILKIKKFIESAFHNSNPSLMKIVNKSIGIVLVVKVIHIMIKLIKYFFKHYLEYLQIQSIF